MRKATGARTAYVYWCAIDERAVEGQFIEVPKWMLDLAACATMRFGDVAWVDLGALRAVQNLLRVPPSKSTEEIRQAQSSSQGETDEQPLSLNNASQLTLTLAEPNAMTWEQLPAPVREELTRLLANLLVVVVNGRRAPVALWEEVNNE
ncbi:hypothetical protein [Caballeronia novacaledonica]|uniref:Uncharacterized protein n=1 Tax=Caballeronia novacaledonica TaxID=1544861 RepID=A0AA37ILM7_9BURK|nr:hypothetical protein [Caballeronia novacaledonica]GJH29066.1 hypothetical protein CBA19CS42_31140 [Caballeronia novacaledonica]